MEDNNTVPERAEKEYPKLPVIERKIVPAIREGIELVMMIVFRSLKEKNARDFPDRDAGYHSTLAAAVLNRMFGLDNPDASFRQFAKENAGQVRDRLDSFARDFPDLSILVTDALRMQFVCNEVEKVGDKDHDIKVMEQAVEAGIFRKERDAPLPKGFMNLVHRVGVANGLVRGGQG
jgi:hypothetical protein